MGSRTVVRNIYRGVCRGLHGNDSCALNFADEISQAANRVVGDLGHGGGVASGVVGVEFQFRG
jgi:hypothetical protein